MSWVVFAFFLVPVGELLMFAIGEWWFHTVAKLAPGKYKRLIIQITTTGSEQDRVNEIITDINSLGLSMPYEIWVVNEPGQGDLYPEAARVITVPSTFVARPQYKARALEYTRLLRKDEGLDAADLKILFLDDDTMPTIEYVETAFVADYDVCQGVTAPRVKYGSFPFSHFVVSHMDDMRFLSCLVYCSFFQGPLARPLFVHGEGLCVTSATEQFVTWDYPLFASEDLVFGQNAVDKGLSWGFFHEYIELTSPWTWAAFLKQRRRWLWGNLNAVFHRDVMTLRAAMLVGLRYVFGLVVLLVSVTGVVLILTSTIYLKPIFLALFWTSFACWICGFAISGWINSRRPKRPGENSLVKFGHRVGQTLAAIVLCPFSASGAVIVGIVALFLGSPGRFEVIPKTRSVDSSE